MTPAVAVAGEPVGVQSPSGTGQIAYVEQRSIDLTYYLFDSVAPRGAVRVLAEQSVDLPGGGINLAIIGSSHFMEIEAGGSILSEMLACPRPGLVSLPGHVETIGTGNRSHWQEAREGLSYQFDLWRQSYSSAEFLDRVAGLGLPGECRLYYSFPSCDGSGSAVTCLEWQVEGRRAIIATYHTFPGESTIVRTRSMIDFAEARA